MLRAAIVVDAGARGAALVVQYEQRVALDVQAGQLEAPRIMRSSISGDPYSAIDAARHRSRI